VKSVPGSPSRPIGGTTSPEPPVRRTSSPRPSGVAAIAAAAILVVAIISLNIPYYAITPGPTENVAQLVTISGAKTSPVSGQLLLTTVSLHEMKVGEAVRGWFDPSFDVLSRSTIIPPGSSEREVEQRTTEQMSESQLFAASAALSYLGYHVQITQSGVRIRDVAVDVPAFRLLHAGDLIVGADGKAVHKPDDLRAVIHRHKVGDTIGLRIMRGKQTINISAPTVSSPQSPSEPVIGVILDEVSQVKLPLAVKYKVLGIGGPSAGLMFALGIVDLLDHSDLAHGRVIAGTGEIDLGGGVHAVGGVRQKLVSARTAKAVLFLVPSDELAEACASAKELKVVGVANLKEAVAVLRDSKVAEAHRCR
jgi:Lon-like protease